MEKIKRILKLKYKLLPTNKPISGSTEFYDNFVVDDTYEHNIKFQLQSNNHDLGLFNIDTDTSDDFNDIPIIDQDYSLTGSTYSRLSELEKYVKTDVIADKYIISTDGTSNGISLSESTLTSIKYFINNMTYVDTISNGVTTTISLTEGHLYDKNINGDYINIQNKVIYKHPQFENVVDKPIIHEDIFIERPNIGILEKNYRLDDITNVSDLINYVAGSYFKIIENY